MTPQDHSGISVEAFRARTFAESPAPEHCRVDPESALTVSTRARLEPGQPQPVYSTLALSHGKKALGASALRPEFAWNERMDLLWALGYPYCCLLVDDNAPVLEQEEQLGLWKELLSTLRMNAFRVPPPVPRALASALLREGLDRTRLEKSTASEFEEATRFVPTNDDCGVILGAWYERSSLHHPAFLLEAFLGPEPVVSALLDLAERHGNPADKVRAENALYALPPLLLRLLPSEREKAIERLRPIDAEGDADIKSYTNIIFRPIETAERNPASGSSKLRFTSDCESLMLKCLSASKPGDIPQTRNIFPGGLEVAKLECSRFKKYDPQDVVAAYLRDYSTTYKAGMLPGLLQCFTKKDARETLSLWFQAHREQLHSELMRIQQEPDHAPLVGKALKSLGW